MTSSTPKRIAAIVWEYWVPLMFLLLSVDTLLGDPNRPILKSVPIVPGEYQYHWAAGFALASAFTALAVYRHKSQATVDDSKPPQA